MSMKNKDNFKLKKTADISNTCAQKYIEVNTNILLSIFGKPHFEYDNEVEWRFGRLNHKIGVALYGNKKHYMIGAKTLNTAIEFRNWLLSKLEM